MPHARRPQPSGEARVQVAPSVAHDVFQHRGRWVAVTPDTIVAVADTRSEALEQAEERGVGEPIVYKVPEDGRRSYFY